MKESSTASGKSFEIIYNSLNEIYDKQNEENEKNTQKGVGMLNILFGMSILGTLASLCLLIRDDFFGAPNPSQPRPLDFSINAIVTIIISIVLIIAIVTIIKGRIEAKKSGVHYTVDAVISDGKGNVLLVNRHFPPFKDHYALPGSFMHEKENYKDALVRTCKEIGVKVKIGKKIGVYDEEGRDPRGNVITTAFQCTAIEGLDKTKGTLVPVSKLKEINIAFDHRNILQDAGFT